MTDFQKPNRDELRAAARADLDALHDTALLTAAGATSVQRELWPAKQSAAERVIEGKKIPTDMALLGPEAETDGITIEQLANKIMKYATAHLALAGAAGAALEAGKAKIRAIFDDEALDDIAANTKARTYLDETRGAIPLKINELKKKITNAPS